MSFWYVNVTLLTATACGCRLFLVGPSRQSAASAASGLGLARFLDTVLTAVVMCVGRLARDCYEVSVDVPELR